MKKKILILSDSLVMGGIEKSLIGLLFALDSKKYEVDLFLKNHSGEYFNLIPYGINLLPEVPQYKNIEKPAKQLAKDGNYLFLTLKILSHIKLKFLCSLLKISPTARNIDSVKWRMYSFFLPKISPNKVYDIALGFQGMPKYYRANIRATKKIEWIHTDFSHVNSIQFIEERHFKELDYIVSVSNMAEEIFLQYFPDFSRKSLVIENILPSEFVLSQALLLEFFPNSFSTNRIKLCSVGRYHFAKGYDIAIKAAKELKKRDYNFVWHIIGFGSQENTLKDLIKEYKLEDCFIMLGLKENPYPYINNSDIYIQPSRYEGKSVAVREAQMLQKPVLISNYKTAKSQVEHLVDGYICDTGVTGLVEGLCRMITDDVLRENLSNNCMNRDYSNKGEVNKIYSLTDY
jgi:glycosyltransferase involved in cell wall biosynthesis